MQLDLLVGFGAVAASTLWMWWGYSVLLCSRPGMSSVSGRRHVQSRAVQVAVYCGYDDYRSVSFACNFVSQVGRDDT